MRIGKKSHRQFSADAGVSALPRRRASAPIVLMPAAIALFVKRRHAALIVFANVLVWGGICLLLKSAILGGGLPYSKLPSPGLILVLLVWLVLRRFSISRMRETEEVLPAYTDEYLRRFLSGYAARIPEDFFSFRMEISMAILLVI